MRIWKVGIIGCGGAMLCIHLPILQQHSHLFEIVALYDADNERTVLAAKRVSNARIHQNIESFFKDDIDIVVILSQNHEDIIEKALKSKKHVFTEKPISLDLSKSNNLQKIANSQGLLLEVGLMRLYDKIVKEFYRQLPPENIISGTFYKADGSDALVRRSILPQALDVYNFHKFAPPIVPGELSNKQILVLKNLLWSGIHLLTTLCEKFPNVEVLSCFANAGATSVVCVFKTSDNQQLTLHLCNTNAPVYIENITVVSDTSIGCLEFSSPYIVGGLTKAKISRKDGLFVECENFTNYQSSFSSMWNHIADVLSGKENPISLDIALQVEQLARQAAEICC